MSKNGFRELQVWQKSKNLAVTIYQITNNTAYKRDLGLQDQMRRAAVSIASNISEGDERGTRFLSNYSFRYPAFTAIGKSYFVPDSP
jgi:hypothetical protein